MRDDAPASGRVWVEPESGAIVRTELRLSSEGTSVVLLVDFSLEPKLGMWVPERMTESYEVATRGLHGASGGRLRSSPVKSRPQPLTPTTAGSPSKQRRSFGRPSCPAMRLRRRRPHALPEFADGRRCSGRVPRRAAVGLCGQIGRLWSSQSTADLGPVRQ